jgi:hypothetical protein
MATTTNYAWATPDNTDLVKDGALAIRTLGSSIDTTTKALNPSTTLGDIEYRSATANTNTRLAIGTTGQVLTVSGGVPAWTAPAGGGKVLQVVNATVSTQASTTSTTYSDTGLTATITPSASTSKVLVILMQNGVAKVGDTSVDLKLVRAGSDITQFVGSAAFDNGTGWNDIGTAGITYLDSPATTSATTYKTQFKSGSSGNTAYVQLFGADSSDMAKSSITLIEIGA